MRSGCPASHINIIIIARSFCDRDRLIESSSQAATSAASPDASATAPPAPQLQRRTYGERTANVRGRSEIDRFWVGTCAHTSARLDTRAHRHPTYHPHIPPYQVIDALLLCHAENPYAKFMGACNDQKVALDQCFRVSAELCLVSLFVCMRVDDAHAALVGRRGAGPGLCRSVHRRLAIQASPKSSMPRTLPVSVCTHTCVSSTFHHH